MEYDPKDKKFPWKGDLWKYSFKGEVKKVKKIIKKGGVQINDFDECKPKFPHITIHHIITINFCFFSNLNNTHTHTSSSFFLNIFFLKTTNSPPFSTALRSNGR